MSKMSQTETKQTFLTGASMTLPMIVIGIIGLLAYSRYKGAI